ncbi:MAG TPA: response regulator [Methylomirabilota bacterium]|nr:response regulator [Methylomirabilota bacterium]
MAQVLLIEPDHVLAKTYGQALVSDGHHVVAAATAQAGVQAADAVKPEVVVLELQLVEHSGIEFLYEFRSYQDWQDIPVLVQTQVPPAEFNENWRLLKNELGVRAYLYKPHTSLRELLAHVKQHNPATA